MQHDHDVFSFENVAQPAAQRDAADAVRCWRSVASRLAASCAAEKPVVIAVSV